MTKPLTILMTGAHITPAVAVTQEILRKVPNARIIYAGRAGNKAESFSVERSEIERAGGIFKTVISGKLHRFFTWSQLMEFGKFPVGLLQSALLLLKEKPQAVVSFGGYLSVPFVITARLVGIPVIIHEETTVWGMANRICRRWASVVAVSWPKMQEAGTVLTGNPMPKEIVEAGRGGNAKKERSRPMIYVTEGSQSSLVISKIVKQILNQLLEFADVYHQTKYPALDINSSRYHSARWFPTPEHAILLSRASIAISRSGANTITYHAYFGIPSILVPLPHAGENEQMKNAALLSETGLARIVPQKDFTADRLLLEIRNLLAIPGDQWKEIRIRAQGLVNPDAASQLADLVLSAALQQ